MKNDVKNVSKPGWVLSGGRVDEVAFCSEFIRSRYLAYADGAVFSPEGRISDLEELRREIYLVLREHISCSLSPKVESILHTLQLECSPHGLEPKPEDILELPLANGTLHLATREFSPIKHLTRYRLPVAYDPNAPRPERWLNFLSQLLEEEDILTLQEYMGYCLIPTTLGQKMLMIIGRGGEGKSRIGVVMKALLGSNMNQGSIAKIEASPFARADLQNLLVLVDDDLKMDALKHTGYLKSIITAELPMDLEKKGIQSYQGTLNVRFLAFGNDSLRALYDHSHGFFRRQIILTAKEKSPDRKDDPFLAYGLTQEKEGILLWCIEGLERLFINDFKFTMSRQARINLLEAMNKGCNILEFLKSKGYICLEAEGCITSKNLYTLYREWCMDNALPPQGSQSFWGFLTQNQKTYGICPTRSIPIGAGKYARGFQGIQAVL